MKKEWIPELPMILIPLHYFAITKAIETNAWALIGFIIGIIHAILGRYRYDLPGNLWLIGEPNKIFLVAIVLWVFWYVVANRTIYKTFCQ